LWLLELDPPQFSQIHLFIQLLPGIGALDLSSVLGGTPPIIPLDHTSRESNKLKNQGFKIISDGIKICANINLSKEDFIQTLLTE
ncbi:hypothetical protein MJO29_002139, partial [Puccinia striiformis f. sp. tritici]